MLNRLFITFVLAAVAITTTSSQTIEVTPMNGMPIIAEDLCETPPYPRYQTSLEVLYAIDEGIFKIGDQFNLVEPSEEALESRSAWIFRILFKEKNGSYRCVEAVRTVPWMPIQSYKYSHRLVWIEREKRLPLPSVSPKFYGPLEQEE